MEWCLTLRKRKLLNVISLGAGVQSSTMALMAAHGEITPMPDAAIFADTGAEPRKVYEWLDWLEKQLPFPVYRVMHKTGLRTAVVRSATDKRTRVATPPFFAMLPDGTKGIIRRQCTTEYKVMPIIKKVRELMGVGFGERVPKDKKVTQWFGISTDEAHRMKPSKEAWSIKRYPLIEAGMSRGQCLQWMQNKGYPNPPKSACTFCPYHDDHLWREMKLNDADSWADAVYIDSIIRDGTEGVTSKLFLHRSLVPLDQVDFRNAADMGQLSMFGNECEGMCGV